MKTVTCIKTCTKDTIQLQARIGSRKAGLLEMEYGTRKKFEDSESYDYFCDEEVIRERGRVALITSVQVPAPLRKRGIGSLLVAQALVLAQEACVPAVYLHASEGGESTEAFWRRMAFEVADSDARGIPYMVRRLSRAPVQSLIPAESQPPRYVDVNF